MKYFHGIIRRVSQSCHNCLVPKLNMPLLGSWDRKDKMIDIHEVRERREGHKRMEE
jgi:hypothetical protein